MLMGGQAALRAVDYVAHQRILAEAQNKRPAHMITRVGRLTDQKMALLLQPAADGSTALDRILKSLSGRGLFLLLGSGDAELEEQCRQQAAKHSQLIFINQYSMKLANLLFSNGDLFLMPSSFEPCGISQMLAMKEGQPCIAHSVGGLRDTIEDDRDGFLFEGDSMNAQANALVARVEQVLLMRQKKPDSFTRIAAAARKKRFNWSTSASRYHSELYS